MVKPAKILTASCGAHFFQDGLVALQYLLLPLIAQSLGLNYAQVGILRAVGHTAMSGFEIPAGMLADRMNPANLLVFGLFCAAVGYVGISFSSDFTSLLLFFFIAGLGAAFQHSLASAMIVNALDTGARRRALGVYNAFGDAGKLGYTGLLGLAMGAGLAWSSSIQILAGLVVVFGLWVLFGLSAQYQAVTKADSEKTEAKGRLIDGIVDARKFLSVSLAVFLDSVIQAVFLTFIVFYLVERGVSSSIAALGVVLLLSGGMVGKFFCGWFASRFGDCYTFFGLQAATAAAIGLLAIAHPDWLIYLLPLAGIVIQGSSTVTYGSVADFLKPDFQSRGYALIYTVSSVSSVVGPLVFGLIADSFSILTSIHLLALLALLTLPLSFALSRRS